MGKIETIEREIERLDDTSFAAFRTWFVQYDSARWDRQIESDSLSGKLDALIDDAVAEHNEGKSKPL
jgi:hypothetical protein